MSSRLSQAHELVRQAEAEGWHVRKIKSGWMLIHPRGGSTSVHTSSSDCNAVRSIRRAMNRVIRCVGEP
jgi:hypothetical protein